MNKDKISIIIPTYNRADTIKASLQSVLSQSYANLEIIVINDGSTDNTEKIVFSVNDSRIKYFKQKHSGACAARNLGIKKATGKFISFQDSDDVYKKDKILKQYQNIIANKSDIDFCSITIHDKYNNITFPNQRQLEAIHDNRIVDCLCLSNFISTQAILGKSSIFKNNLFDINLPRLQDYDLILRLINKYTFSFTDKILVDLFRQENSISNDDDKLLVAAKIMSDKNYGFNKNQTEALTIQFNNIIINAYNLILNSNYSVLLKEKDSYQNLYLTEKEKSKGLKKEVNQLNRSISDLQKQYDKIINSKTWKFKTKLYKIMFNK